MTFVQYLVGALILTAACSIIAYIWGYTVAEAKQQKRDKRGRFTKKG